MRDVRAKAGVRCEQSTSRGCQNGGYGLASWALMYLLHSNPPGWL